MRGALASRSSRRRLNTDFGSLTELTSKSASLKPSLVPNLAHNTSGTLQPVGNSGPVDVSYSSASFNANDISTNQRILQADQSGLFSAVFSTPTGARGSSYLKQFLYEELLAQRRKSNASFAAALQSAIEELNRGFQSLHPFNLNVLQGVEIAVTYVDFERQALYLASNGGCRCIVGRKGNQLGSVQIVADVGVPDILPAKDAINPISQFADVPLTQDIDFMILGSSGFWKEVWPAKAALRVHHFFKTAPHSSNGSAAASLINYTLHCVTQRLRGHTDRRMVSLNSVSNLVSLQAGHKGQYKYGNKQPVRRRRADVHDDLTVIVAAFHWQGKAVSSQGSVKHSRWDTVRMVMRFHTESSMLTKQAWYSLVKQSLSHPEFRSPSWGKAMTNLSRSSGGSTDTDVEA